MADWQDENLSAVLEYPFDFESYIARLLRDIEDLDERRFAKQVLLEGVGRLIKETEKKYKDLEKRVYQEISMDANAYGIVSTVVEIPCYDPTNDTLFPIISMDLDIEKLREALGTKEQSYVGTVFLKADGKTCKAFGERGQFPADVFGEGCVVFVKRAERYRKMIEELYYMFQDNHVLWETVNTAYLEKLYDVFIPGETAAEKSVGFGDVKIDYGMYQAVVKEDVMPLWNIERITFDSMNFMMPCLDGIYYEHEFSIQEREPSDGYLIEMNEDILEIRHEKGKIIIKSAKETFERWSALHIVQKETVLPIDYEEPLMTNRRRDTFIRRYANGARAKLLTKAELFRKIMELDIGEYLEVTDYKILEEDSDYPAEEGMNWFVGDEVFPVEGRRVLLLYFKEKKPGNYLNDSVMRFVISQIQMEMSEYRCIGILDS